MTRTAGGLAEAAGGVDSLWLLAGLLFVVNAWAIILVFWSSASGSEKALWSIVILAVPILGAVAWYVLGPKPNLLSEHESADRPTAAGGPAASKEGGS